MIKHIFILVFLLTSVEAMACLQASFDRLNCKDSIDNYQETYVIENIKLSKSQVEFTDEGEKVKFKLPITTIDEELPGFVSKVYCMGKAIVEEDSYKNLTAKTTRTLVNDEVITEGTTFTFFQNCEINQTEEECMSQPYSVKIEQYRQVCTQPK